MYDHIVEAICKIKFDIFEGCGTNLVVESYDGTSAMVDHLDL